MEEVKVGILGCGVISHTYIQDIQRLYPKLKIIACADLEEKIARGHAEKYGIPVGCTPEELLKRDELEIVINLTPPKFHTEINKQILEAGKHVFCEKPFALTLQEAEEICILAKKKGKWICSAPDTFLGSSIQTCKKLLADGWIGKPLYAAANMMSAGVETWHPSPENFYREGAGPLYDMGPYYFTALAVLLGAVKRISAFSKTGFGKRQIYAGARKGQEFLVETPTHYSGILELESGVLVSMNLSFDIWKSNLPMLEIYGTEGTLEVPDPNLSGGRPKVYRKEQNLDALYDKEEGTKARKGISTEVPELYPHVGDYTRGAGVLDLAYAIEENRAPRTEGRLACHVIEAIMGMKESAETGTMYEMKTTCESPPPLQLGALPQEEMKTKIKI